MDYVNAPVGKGTRPRAAAQAAGGGADHDRHRRGVDDDLRARRAVAQGEDRHQPPRLRPTLAVVDPTLTMTQPAGGDRRVGHGHPLPRARELHRAAVHVVRRASSPSSGCPTAARTRSRTCGRRRRCRCSRRRSAGRCATATTSTAREQMAMAATFAGLGFGNAGVHIPHANAYPIAGRVRGLPPRRLPRRRADGAARDGGLADRARGVPVHLRGRARAPPARRARCSARTTPTTTAPTRCPACSPT